MLDHDFTKEKAFQFESGKYYYQPNPFIGESVLYMEAFDASKFLSRKGMYINFSKGALLQPLMNHWALDYLPWVEIPQAVYDQVVECSRELNQGIERLLGSLEILPLPYRIVEANKCYLVKNEDAISLFLAHKPKSESRTFVEGITLEGKGLIVHRKQITIANKEIVNENSMMVDAAVLTQCYAEYDGYVRKIKKSLLDAGIHVTDTSKAQSAEMKEFRARYQVLKYYFEGL